VTTTESATQVVEPDGRSSWRRLTRRGAPRADAVDSPREPLTPFRFSVVVTLLTLLGLAAWFMFYFFVLSGVQEAHDQAVDYSHIRQELALATVPIGGAISAGSPVALMSIPRLGLYHVVVVEGTSSTQLESGPGHLPDTPLPGQAGYSVLLGRSSTFGAPFRSLPTLRAGNVIAVTTGQGRFIYTVADVRAPGDPLPPALGTGKSRLVLVTSQSRGWRHAWTPGQVRYVDANLTHGAVQQRPAGAPIATAVADQPFKGDDSNLIALALWLQLFVAFVAATGWAWLRWSKPQLWLVAAPAGLAILWGTTSAVAPLLPNLT
jgi:sortase A